MGKLPQLQLLQSICDKLGLGIEKKSCWLISISLWKPVENQMHVRELEVIELPDPKKTKT